MTKNTLTTDIVCHKLARLKTPALAECFRELVSTPRHQNLTLLEAMDMMADRELESRDLKRQERYLQRSGLRDLAVWNQADESKGIYSAERNLSKRDVSRLMTCEWIRAGHNVMINGATGTGKTWLLAVLGKQVCMSGFPVLYMRYAQILEKLSDARAHNETTTLRHQWNRHSLLIIDDFGSSSISQDLASDLLTMLEEREGVSSIAIASQLPFNAWHERLGKGLNADAIMDRLINTSYEFSLSGNSLRERPDVNGLEM